MKMKVQMVIMSHLSDVQEPVGDLHPHTVKSHQNQNNNRINFVKFLIQRYPNTLDTIDPDKEYADFIKKFPQFAI